MWAYCVSLIPLKACISLCIWPNPGFWQNLKFNLCWGIGQVLRWLQSIRCFVFLCTSQSSGYNWHALMLIISKVQRLAQRSVCQVYSTSSPQEWVFGTAHQPGQGLYGSRWLSGCNYTKSLLCFILQLPFTIDYCRGIEGLWVYLAVWMIILWSLCLLIFVF